MFKKLAKIRPFETWRVAPGTGALHSNDNLPGFRHPVGREHPRPNRRLACHWYLIGDRLECSWDIEAPDGAPIDKLESQPKESRALGSRLARLLRAAG